MGSEHYSPVAIALTVIGTILICTADAVVAGGIALIILGHLRSYHQ